MSISKDKKTVLITGYTLLGSRDRNKQRANHQMQVLPWRHWPQPREGISFAWQDFDGSLFLLSIPSADNSVVPGFHVIATARRPAVLNELADMGMTAIALDVTKPESIAAAKDAVAALTGGRLDVLVNNA
jgi:hypothetical protein